MGLALNSWRSWTTRRRHVLTVWSWICIFIGLGCYVLFLQADSIVARQRRMAEGAECEGNLSFIGSLLFEYRDKYGHFPPAYTVDKDGRPMHSWRALLLKIASEPDVSYDFNEPWDGPNNIKLVDKIPRFYICPSDHDRYKRSTTFTSYLAIAGPGTAFPGAATTQLAGMRGRLGASILVAEVADSGVVWSEPRDLDVRSMGFVINDPTRPSISSKHGSPNVLFADRTRRDSIRQPTPTSR